MAQYVASGRLAPSGHGRGTESVLPDAGGDGPNRGDAGRDDGRQKDHDKNRNPSNDPPHDYPHRPSHKPTSLYQHPSTSLSETTQLTSPSFQKALDTKNKDAAMSKTLKEFGTADSFEVVGPDYCQPPSKSLKESRITENNVTKNAISQQHPVGGDELNPPNVPRSMPPQLPTDMYGMLDSTSMTQSTPLSTDAGRSITLKQTPSTSGAKYANLPERHKSNR